MGLTAIIEGEMEPLLGEGARHRGWGRVGSIAEPAPNGTARSIEVGQLKKPLLLGWVQSTEYTYGTRLDGEILVCFTVEIGLPLDQAIESAPLDADADAACTAILDAACAP